MIVKEYMLARDYISLSLKKESFITLSDLVPKFNIPEDLLESLLINLEKIKVLRKNGNGYKTK